MAERAGCGKKCTSVLRHLVVATAVFGVFAWKARPVQAQQTESASSASETRRLGVVPRLEPPVLRDVSYRGGPVFATVQIPKQELVGTFAELAPSRVSVTGTRFEFRARQRFPTSESILGTWSTFTGYGEDISTDVGHSNMDVSAFEIGWYLDRRLNSSTFEVSAGPRAALSHVRHVFSDVVGDTADDVNPALDHIQASAGGHFFLGKNVRGDRFAVEVSAWGFAGDSSLGLATEVEISGAVGWLAIGYKWRQTTVETGSVYFPTSSTQFLYVGLEFADGRWEEDR